MREQIRDRLALSFEDGGEQSVKNIARPIRVYALSADAVAALPKARGAGGTPAGGAALPAPKYCRRRSGRRADHHRRPTGKKVDWRQQWLPLGGARRRPTGHGFVPNKRLFETMQLR